MPLPVDLNTVTVTGSFPNIAGQPQSGSVVFDPGGQVTDTVGLVVMSGAVTAQVHNGVMAPVTLPCTDNASLNPTGFTYLVTATINGTKYASFSVLLPHTLGATVDLASLVPASSNPGTSTVYGVLALPNRWTAANTFTAETIVQAPVNPGDAATKAYVDANTGAVSSVNGHTGTVVLAASDVGAVPTSGGTVTGNLAVRGNADAKIVAGLVTRDQVSNFYTSNGASSATITFAANPTAGAKVLVALANVAATPVLTDNGVTPSTFTRDQGNILGTNNIHIFRADNITLPASGLYQINVTSGGSTFAALAVSYLGLRTGGPLSSSSGHSTGTVTALTSLTNNGVCSGLVFGGVSDSNTSVHSVSVGNPFTAEAASAGGSGAPGGFSAADWLDDVVPALQLPAWTFGSSSEWEAAVVTYQPVFSIVGSPSIYGSGINVVGLTSGSGSPVFRVMNSGNGIALTANDDSSLQSAHNTLDDGSGNANVSGVLTVGGNAVSAGMWLPSDNGLLGSNFPLPSATTTGSALVAGTVYLAKLNIRQSVTVSRLWLVIDNAGSGASTGSFVGLYNSSGTLLTGSSDAGAGFAAFTNTYTLTTPQVLSAGSFVWAAILSNLASTQPQLHVGYGSGANAFIPSLNLTAATYAFATNGTGRTSLAASIVPASNNDGSPAQAMWIGYN